jgi:stage II sporulation protein P
MKWTPVTLTLAKVRKMFQSVGSIGKLFVIMSLGTFALFICLGLGGFMQSKMMTTSPVSSMKGLAASVSNQFFIDMMGLEVPHLNKEEKKFTFSQHNVFQFAFQLLTDINPNDPKSLVASELPGMQSSRTTVLRSSQATNPSVPMDLEPHPDVFEKDPQTELGAAGSEPTPTPKPAAQPPRTAGKNVAFIYQTHSNESFLPDLPGVTEPDKAYNDTVNITQVGKRLAMNLEKNGIGAVHSETIYPDTVKGFQYAYSYKYSLKTLQEAAAAHPDLEYYFDIHRDSAARNKTTVNLNGVDHAQVFFIIGGKNASWKKNEEFANDIHQILEAKHPGISKGIHAKAEKESNGVFNQHFSPQNILIEVGGPYNSMEECYRTMDLLAEAISEVILNAKKVDAPAPVVDAVQSSNG